MRQSLPGAEYYPTHAKNWADHIRNAVSAEVPFV